MNPSDEAHQAHRHRHHHRSHHRSDRGTTEPTGRRRSSRSRSPRSEHDGVERRHRNHKRHRREKRERSGRDSPADESSSSSDDRRATRAQPPPIRWAAAGDVLESLARAQPSAAGDLLLLLEMLDKGEGVAVDGVPDPVVRVGLSLFLSTLDCDEVQGPDGTAFVAPLRVRHASCMTILAPRLRSVAGAAGGSAGSVQRLPRPDLDDEISSSSCVPHPSSTVCIGPARPPANFDAAAAAAAVAAEEEDDDVGPLPAHDPRSRRPDPRVQMAMLRAAGAPTAAEEEEEDDAGANGGGPRRDRWMSMAPEGGFASLGTGAGADDASGGRAASKAAPRAGLGWSYLQKKDDDGAAGTAAGGGGATSSAAVTAVPAAAPAAVAAASGGSASAPRSLAELYQTQQAKAGGAVSRGGAARSGAERRPFDRERDLAIPRSIDPTAIIARAAALDNKFKLARR